MDDNELVVFAATTIGGLGKESRTVIKRTATQRANLENFPYEQGHSEGENRYTTSIAKSVANQILMQIF